MTFISIKIYKMNKSKVKLYKRWNVRWSLLFWYFVGVIFTYKNLRAIGDKKRAKKFIIKYSIAITLLLALISFLDNVTIWFFSKVFGLTVALFVMFRFEKMHEKYIIPYRKENKDNVEYHTVWNTIKNIVFWLFISLSVIVVTVFAVTPQAFEKSYRICWENTIYKENWDCFCKEWYSPKYYKSLEEERCEKNRIENANAWEKE